jgi:hypothetical protein
MDFISSLKHWQSAPAHWRLHTLANGSATGILRTVPNQLHALRARQRLRADDGDR